MSQTQTLVYLSSLQEMFRARDWLLGQWRQGLYDAAAAEKHLRSMAVRDGQGALWMLRPTPTGSVLVRVALDGEVTMPLPEDFVHPRRKSRLGQQLWPSAVSYGWLWPTRGCGVGNTFERAFTGNKAL